MDTDVSTRARRTTLHTVQPSDFPPPDAVARSAKRPRSSPLERWLLARALARLGHPSISVVLWDGSLVDGTQGRSECRLAVLNRWALWQLLTNPWHHFGQLYAQGSVEVPDGLEPLLTAVYRARQRLPNPSAAWGRGRWRIWRWNSLRRARHNIHHHYDIGNDFYRLWLDEQLVYTCAYYATPEMTLEEAQIAKFDHVCRKLGLAPGQQVVEAGCGWGGLALHMARHYGVQVKAFNISREQVAHARAEARRQGLADRVTFVEADWRTADEPCDAFVSVGMLEHVGPENYRVLGNVIHRCLRPRGRGLIHSIGQNRPGPTSSWIERHIFPGAYPPALREMVQLLERHDFSVLDVENLRLHYAQTLRHWLGRFEANVGAVREMFDDSFVRSWRLYLWGSQIAFTTGGLQLFQLTFSRGDNNHIPWTRAGLYTPHTPSPVL